MSDYDARQSPLVLAAEDSPTVLAMISSRLERAGYEVLSARDGEAALELARARVPSLVILDVEMPKLDGLEVTRRLRGDDATRAIPVLLVTAHVGPADVAAGMEAGATEYIEKPFSPQELAASVERILGRRY